MGEQDEDIFKQISSSTAQHLQILTKQLTMLRTAAIAALGLASASAYKLAEETLLKRDGAHAHEHADSGYGAPAPAYEEPAASYGAPAPSYGAPETGYGPPAETYGVPSYEEEPLPDLTLIIVGILVLTGLSLLFPTFVNITQVGRKKRHAEEEADQQTDVIERVNEIYTAVVQSEECMEKIACVVGALAGDVGLTQSPALKIAGGFVPSKYKTYYNQFTTGKDCHKIKCGTFA